MWFTSMDAGDAQTCFKLERERNVGRFFWWSDAAGPQPKLSVARLCCFAAFLHKGEEACFLISWVLVLGDVACDSCAVVLAVALDVPPRAHFHLSFPARPVLWELFAESVLPGFTCCECKILSCAKFLMRLPLSFLLLRFFLLPPFPSPLFPAVACLVSLVAAVLNEFATFLKDAGKFIWKAPLSTC